MAWEFDHPSHGTCHQGCPSFGFCHCGCGRKTNLATATLFKVGRWQGQPSTWVVGHCAKRIKDINPDLKGCWSVNGTPVSTVRDDIRAIKRQTGLNLRQIAQITGINYSTMTNMVYARRAKFANRDAAQKIAKLREEPPTVSFLTRKKRERPPAPPIYVSIDPSREILLEIKKKLGMTHDAMADYIGIPRGTIRNIMARWKDQMRITTAERIRNASLRVDSLEEVKWLTSLYQAPWEQIAEMANLPRKEQPTIEDLTEEEMEAIHQFKNQHLRGGRIVRILTPEERAYYKEVERDIRTHRPSSFV